MRIFFLCFKACICICLTYIVFSAVFNLFDLSDWVMNLDEKQAGHFLFLAIVAAVFISQNFMRLLPSIGKKPFFNLIAREPVEHQLLSEVNKISAYTAHLNRRVTAAEREQLKDSHYPPSGRKEVARHEAAHALVAYQLGFITLGACIYPTGGHVVSEPNCLTDTDPFNHFKVAVISYAGYVAIPNASNLEGSNEDYQKAYAQLMQYQIHNNQFSFEELASFAKSTALDIIKHNTQALDQLEQKLLKRNSLTGAEIVKVIGDITGELVHDETGIRWEPKQ